MVPLGTFASAVLCDFGPFEEYWTALPFLSSTGELKIGSFCSGCCNDLSKSVRGRAFLLKFLERIDGEPELGGRTR